MKDGDALQREIERGKLLARAFGLRRGDLGGGDGDAGLGEIDPVELARIIDQGLIAARDDVLDDLADGMVHVGRGFALHRQKRRETIPEVGRRRIQTQSHVHLQLEVPAVMTPRRRLRQAYASGMMKRGQRGPRSPSCASMQSTSSKIVAPPANIEADAPLWRGRARLEEERQQHQQAIGTLARESAIAHGAHGLEMQRREATLQASQRLRGPVEARGDQRETLFFREIGEIANSHHRVLKMRRNQGEILGVERE